MSEQQQHEEREVAADPKLIRALLGNYHEEMVGAATYQTLADREENPVRKKALQEMADSEMDHAKRWARRIVELGAPEPIYSGRPTGTADSFANRIGGPNATLRRIELEERHHVMEYGRQIRALGDRESVAILQDLIADEKEHSRVLKRLAGPIEDRYPQEDLRVRDPAMALADLRETKRSRRAPASWIGDAIYGVNDGLGAIFGIVSGVSGATTGNSQYVLLAGLAGMVASALSMGSGAYLAAKSEREIYEAELHRRQEAFDSDPEAALEEMTLVYQVKGAPIEDAHRMAQHLYQNPEKFVRTLATEELNISEEALRNPIVSAVSGSVSTAVGAFIPIIPFFFMQGWTAVVAAAVISLLAHFAVGAAKTLITVRSWWSSGLEMTIVGAIEGVVTYFIGVGLGHIHV